MPIITMDGIEEEGMGRRSFRRAFRAVGSVAKKAVKVQTAVIKKQVSLAKTGLKAAAKGATAGLKVAGDLAQNPLVGAALSAYTGMPVGALLGSIMGGGKNLSEADARALAEIPPEVLNQRAAEISGHTAGNPVYYTGQAEQDEYNDPNTTDERKAEIMEHEKEAELAILEGKSGNKKMLIIGSAALGVGALIFILMRRK